MVRKKQVNRQDIVDQLKVMAFKVLRAAREAQLRGKLKAALFPLRVQQDSYLIGMEYLQSYGFYAAQVDAVVKSLKWVIHKIDDIDLPLTPDDLDTLILACEDLLGAIRAAPVTKTHPPVVPDDWGLILEYLSTAKAPKTGPMIIEETGIPERTVKNILPAMEKDGLIDRPAGTKKKGYRVTMKGRTILAP